MKRYIRCSEVNEFVEEYGDRNLSPKEFDYVKDRLNDMKLDNLIDLYVNYRRRFDELASLYIISALDKKIYDPKTPDSALSKFMDNPDLRSFASDIATNPNASASTLLKIYEYGVSQQLAHVLEPVAQHDNTPIYIVEKLAEYPHSAVRRVAENALDGKKTYKYRLGKEPIDLEEQARRKQRKYILDCIKTVAEDIILSWDSTNSITTDEIVDYIIDDLEGDAFNLNVGEYFSRKDVAKIVEKLMSQYHLM